MDLTKDFFDYLADLDKIQVIHGYHLKILELKARTMLSQIEFHYNYATKALVDFAEDIATNYDHDEDAHRHDTSCRMCEAETVLQVAKANIN